MYLSIRRALVATITTAAAAFAQQDAAARFHGGAEIVVADSAEAVLVDRRVPLRYPQAEREAGIEAAFAIAFVVDTAGRVEMPTVSFLGVAPVRFRTEMCRWLRRIQITPVVRDGLARRVFSVQPFNFELGGGPPHTQSVPTEPLRRLAREAGVAGIATAIEPQPHC